MLNQAWAFGTIGEIAWWVGIGLAVAAFIVFLALMFELFVAPRTETEYEKTPTGTLAPVAR